MKAAVVRGPKHLVVEEVPDPKPGPDQVLIRMRYCGICGSDLHMYEHRLAPAGSIMGHEWVGEVAEPSPGVTDWSVGDRVWPGGRFIPDWTWKPEYGWDQEAWFRDDYVKDMGGYGQYAVYHRRSLAPVPEGVTDLEACMADQAATGLGAVHASRLQIGETALVIGAGPIGLWALRCAQLAGARKIAVSELADGRAQHARDMGADLVVDARNPTVREQVTDFFDGIGPDVVLECVGSESAFRQAVDIVRPNGRVALVGISNDPITITSWNIYLKGVELRGVLHLDFKGGMDMIRRKRVDCREFLSEVIPLERAPEVFLSLLHPTNQKKVVIGHLLQA